MIILNGILFLLMEKETAPWPKRLVTRLPPLGFRIRVSDTQCGVVVDETKSG